MSATKPITDHEIIVKYFEIKDYIKAETDKFEAEIGPVKAKLELLENALLARLNARNANNTKTDAGTAYKTTRLDVQVEDRNRFLKFCLDNWEKWGSDMLGVRAVTEHVRHYIDDSKKRDCPPGTLVSSTTRVNIRRA
jgi:hypothetical protein